MGLLDDAIREHLELRRRQGADASEVARLEQEALGPVVRGETPSSQPEADAAEVAYVDEQQLAIDDEPFAEQQPAEGGAYEEAPADFYEHDHEEPLAVDDQPAFHDHHDALSEPDAALEHPPVPDPSPVEPLDPLDPVGPVVEHEGYVPPAGVGQPTEEYDVEAVRAAVHGEPQAQPIQPAEHEQSNPADTPPAEVQPDGVHAPEGEIPKTSPVEGGEPAVGAEEREDVLEQTPEFLQETPEHDRLWFEQAPPKDFDFDR